MRAVLNGMLVSAILAFVAVSAVYAQPGRRYYVDAGWQFNATVANDFAAKANGWGAYAEGGYYVLPRVAVGGFVSFNTNNEYIPRDTYLAQNGGALTTDMTNSIFQIPFGATMRYRLSWKKFQPYAQAKVGANYAAEYMYLPTMTAKDDQWGFYVSPEIGLTWHPFYKLNLGLQLSVYYSYATNRSMVFGINGINNAGFKLGVSF